MTRREKILFLLRLLADHVPGIGLVARKYRPARNRTVLNVVVFIVPEERNKCFNVVLLVLL